MISAITKNISKRIVSVLLVSLMFVLGGTAFNPHVVTAHTLKVDRAIGVTMHINPDDEPIAGAQSQILVSIQDKAGLFEKAASDCICAVTILLNGVAVETLPFIMTGSSAMVSYTFQQNALYKLEVSGSSRVPGSFQNFSTTFLYRVRGGDGVGSSVEVEEAGKNPLQTYLPFVVFGTASFLVVLCMLPLPTPKIKKRGKK